MVGRMGSTGSESLRGNERRGGLDMTRWRGEQLTPSSMLFFGKYIWLVVSTPLKNISQLGIIIPNRWKIWKNVPNHQPDVDFIYVDYNGGLWYSYGFR